MVSKVGQYNSRRGPEAGVPAMADLAAEIRKIMVMDQIVRISQATPPAQARSYLPLPLQLLNLNEPIRVAQLKLPVVA